MTDVDEEGDVATVAGLLADDVARTILEATTNEPMSADALAERCDVSTPTVYRRLEQLRDQDLVAERTEPDPDGHHYTVYAATLDRVVVDLTTDGFRLRLRHRDRMADRFTRFVEGL